MKIEEALIDPKWEWGFIIIGDVSLPYLTLHRPGLGELHCILSPETAAAMRKGIGVKPE